MKDLILILTLLIQSDILRYFAGTNWSDVYSRSLVPPIVPCVSGEADTRYFNLYQENEVNIADTVTKEDMMLFADF